MKNLKIDEYIYGRIYIKDKNTLVKYSILPCDIWYNLQKKNLDFINAPTSVYSLSKEEKDKYRMCKSKIEIPWLRGYHTLYDCKFLNNLTTKELLELLKTNLLLLKKLHENGIVHCDIHAKNIMINKNLDINFIDFDNSIIDDYISPSNIFHNNEMSLSQNKEKSITYDKEDIITPYLSYISKLLPKPIYAELCNYFISKSTLSTLPIDYYFLDILDDLIACNYESPLIKCKR